jgi:GTP-binding protein YchF
VGKSTLYNALSNSSVQAENFPFCTINANVGIVPVPDSRLDKLVEIVKPQNVVPAVVQIVDIAGLVRGASKNQGLGNQFLANIRECDAILHVLRCFEDPNIIHVEEKVDPLRDKDIVDIELQLKDLETVDKRLDKSRKNAKSANKDAMLEVAFLESLYQHLQEGKPVRSHPVLNEIEASTLKELSLLTAKPVLYVCNVEETSLPDGNHWVEKVKTHIKQENAEIIIVSAALEYQIQQLEDPNERKEFFEAAGLSEPGLNRLIRSAYKLLGLITYFTAGAKEVRAWTVPAGCKAPQAAGVIHSDLERGFIRAEVIKFDDFVQLRSEAAARDAGKLAVQGKDYIVEDGDIMHFRHNS